MKTELTLKDRENLIEYRLSRATETLEEAQYNADGGYFNTAVNRLYYAAYYAASALMLANGLTANSHADSRPSVMGSIMEGRRDGRYDIISTQKLTKYIRSRLFGDFH